MSKKLNKAEMLALVGAELLGRSEMCYLNDAQDIEAAEMEHNAARVRGFIFVRQGKAFFDGTYQAASVPSQSADPDVLQARRIADLIVPQVLQFWQGACRVRRSSSGNGKQEIANRKSQKEAS